MLKVILFVITVYFLIKEINVKQQFRPFREKTNKSISSLQKGMNTKSDENKLLIKITYSITFILLTMFYVIVFAVVKEKWFQIISTLCFMWSIFDLNLLFKMIDNTASKIIDSKLYSIVSWIIDMSYYSYIIYYIILHW